MGNVDQRAVMMRESLLFVAANARASVGHHTQRESA